MVLRKPGSSLMSEQEAPEAEIEDAEDEQTKESVAEAGEEEMPLDVQVSEMEEKDLPPPPTDPAAGATLPTSCMPVRLQAIKVEQQQQSQSQSPNLNPGQDKMVNHQSLVTVPATALGSHMDWTDLAHWIKGGSSSTSGVTAAKLSAPGLSALGGSGAGTGGGSGSLPVPLPLPSPDADYSFLISLHPYLKEMSGKQNRRFRQKVIGLIDNVLDNIDVW